MAKVHSKIRSGLNFRGVTADPSDAEEGDLIFRTDLTPPRYREYRGGQWADIHDSRFVKLVRTPDAATTGSNATLAAFSTPFISLTNVSLVSLDMIPAGEDGQVITIVNNTGTLVSLNDDTGATPANRIRTGTNKPAKMKDNSSLTLIYNATTSRWHVIGGTGGEAEAGSGGGELVDLLFKARISDSLADIPDGTTPIDIAAGYTDAALHDIVNGLYRLSYDASKTVTGTGMSMTLSGTPSFTVKIGDVLVVGSEVRKITAIPTQTTPTIEAAFSVDPTTAACNVSQAVHTVDLNAFDNNSLGLSVASQISTDVSECLVVYADSETLSDIIPDYSSVARIAYSVSGDGSDWSSLRARVTGLSSEETEISVPTPGSQFRIRFFANKTSGSGAVNLLAFKAYWHRDVAELAGVYQQIAFSRPAAAINQNCSHAIVSGKSRFQFTWSFGRGLSDGQASGSALQVLANGQEVPRYVAGVTDVSQAYFIEIDDNTIEMDQDYSASSTQFMFRLPKPVVDARAEATAAIADLQSTVGAGFQDFVEPPALIDAPYTSIINRAKISNPALDLKARMGVERFHTRNAVEFPSEYGPNGEKVFGLPYDGNIRFVGGWSNDNNSNSGSRVVIPGTGVADYVEITFYGTGLNMLFSDAGSGKDVRVSVDGGAEGSNFYTPNSGIINGRAYSANTVTPALSGLTLGLHTAKIRNNSSGNGPGVVGYEVLNESSSVKIQPGSAYIDGKKSTLLAQSLQNYNSGFESGTLGTRGGRVSVYLKADGTVGKAVTPTNASTTYLTSADHTNEEMIRKYFFREFGASRSANDDYSVVPSSGARSFVLEDGSTILQSTNSGVSTDEVLTVGGVNGAFTQFTFIGTGLDIVRKDTTDGGADTFSYSVDGNTPVTISSTGSTVERIQKIVSGLPYGTHVVRFTRTSVPATYDMGVKAFLIYAPKKPTLPTGAIELADYNIVADYVANTTAGVQFSSTGIIRKANSREFLYVGTWIAALDTVGNFSSGLNMTTGTNTDYIEYTFFGTGLNFRFLSPSAAATWTVSLQSITTGGSLLTYNTTNFAQAAASVAYGNASFGTGTGIITLAGVQTSGAGMNISGLTLGLYKIRITKTSGTNMYIDALDVISPIHAGASSQHNMFSAVAVGNNSISDRRVMSPVEKLDINEKAWAVAVGILSSPTTTSAPYLPLPDMSLALDVKNSGLVEVDFRGSFVYTAGSNTAEFVIFIDGKEFRSTSRSFKVNANSTGYLHITNKALVYLAAGVHKFDIMWSTNGGTLQAAQDLRMMTVREV